MPAASSQMYRISQVGGCTTWVYVTTEAKATIIGANWFNSMAAELTIGDIILVSAARAGTPTMFPLIVLTNNGTTVTVGYGVVS